MKRRRSPLSIGVRVRIARADDPEAGSYSTRVEEIDDERIVVQAPVVQRQPVVLPAGTPVELEFARTESPAEGYYRAETTVLGRSEGPVPLLYLQMPEKWHRQQLRQYFRVRAALGAQVRPLGTEGPWLVTKTRNISGGGCQLLTPRPLETGAAVEGAVKLPEQRIAFKGVVRWVEQLEQGQGGQWVAGIEFTEIDERDRDAVIRFAFRRQIELRLKGMA